MSFLFCLGFRANLLRPPRDVHHFVSSLNETFQCKTLHVLTTRSILRTTYESLPGEDVLGRFMSKS